MINYIKKNSDKKSFYRHERLPMIFGASTLVLRCLQSLVNFVAGLSFRLANEIIHTFL